MNKKSILIKGKRQFDKLMDGRKEKHKRKEMNNTAVSENVPAKHFQCANAILGILKNIKMDPRLKQVLQARIVGPLMTGEERTHLSLALEIGCREHEIIEMEEAGLEILDGYIQKFSTDEFKERYDNEQSIRDILKNG